MKHPVTLSLSLCCIASICDAFVFRTYQSYSSMRISFQQTALSATLPSPEDSAKALTDYMAKSHEDKLKAIKTVEDKKNQEIKALQMELEKLKSQPSSQLTLSTNAAAQNVSVEDLASKLLAYQQYMSQYMVRASEEKLKAVKLAEAAIAKKYEEKLNAFLLNAAPASTPNDSATTAITVTTGVPTTTSLYTDRNTNVVEAAKAGKSRWGDMEVRKAESLVSSSTQLPQPTTSSSSTVNTIIPPEVMAADKGLRKEGAVGGITLAERVAFGSKASAVDVKPTQASSVDLNSAETELYHKRNVMVSAAAKAGKQSRWGAQEVERAVTLAGSSLPSTPASPSSLPPAVVQRVNIGAKILGSATTSTVVAKQPTLPLTEVISLADKGLRKEGAVAGSTLAERVTLGSKLNTVSPASVSILDSEETILYHKRNEMVSAATKAGKQSRWGPREEQRAVSLAGSSLPSTPVSPSSLPPTVVQRVNIGAKILDLATTPIVVAKQPTLPLTEVISLADKGLRKEGAVAGSTLAERVTLGSKLNTVSPASVSILDSEETILYHKRNEMVSAATKAGKQSRWGPREEQRAVSLAGFFF